MSIANYLTFSRLVISPFFLFVYMEHDAIGISDLLLPYALLIMLAITELSDALDGFIARRFNQVTELGKLIDPMADSLVKISVFLTFTLDPIRLILPIVFIFLYRETIISTLRTICALKGFTLAARKSGKIKTVLQAIAAFIVLAMMIPHSMGYLSSQDLSYYSNIVVGFAAAYTIYSGIEYLYANWHFITEKR